MEMPLARAAKRGWTFIFVPITLELPLQAPSDSMYCRMRGPAVEADPASARPNPSRIVFLPRAITLSGMSSYLVFTINSETYLVSPGALGNSFANPAEELPKAPGLTKYVSEFIVNTKYEDIPDNVIALGKKTILDGFGLALAGSASTAGPRIRQYIESLGACRGSSSVIGTKMKVHPRFAALANGISIHADDYDDTGSALHVAAPILPPSFALCELGNRSGKDLMLAFHVGVEVENKISDAPTPPPPLEGHHTTCTCA